MCIRDSSIILRIQSMWRNVSFTFKCYYDENHIFSSEAILRHKQVACMRRKMLFTIFKYLFKFFKYANSPSDDVIYSPKFRSNMMKKISQPICIKCFIRCSKILINVLYNLGLTILLSWQHTGFQISQY